MFIVPADYYKKVSVVVDELPEFDIEAASRLCDFIADNGYSVEKITIDELRVMPHPAIGLGFLLIIPCAASFPLELASILKKYNRQGGKLLILGGPLFSSIVKCKDGVWSKEFPDAKELSAITSAAGEIGEFRMEGLCPSYKVFIARGIKAFDKYLTPDKPLDAVCPMPRPLGAGFANERENRFIPFLKVEGQKSVAAFIMLSKTRAHCELTNGIRPGSISAETVGSVAASIGLLEQDLLSVPGADELILEMLARLSQGIFLFEGGSENFIFRPEGELTFGACIQNSTYDFHEIPVRFTITSASGKIFTREFAVPASEQNIASVSFNLKLDSLEDHSVIVEIPGIDRIEHKLLPEKAGIPSPGEFVKVKNGSFILNGEPWIPVGINYWPLYFPTYELNRYFRGWFDKSVYDPTLVEEDFADMTAAGINLILTRLEANHLERVVPQLRHVLLLCEHYGLKLGLATSNWTNPLYYNGTEFRRLLKESGLAESPALFCYDIVWEFGHRPLCTEYRHYWDDDWCKWIIERYGSIANAEADWGFPADRKADGSITCPTPQHLPDKQLDGPEHAEPVLTREDPCRVMVAAYRRFADDFLSRRFNDAVRDMREADPRHLISFRQGRMARHDISHSAAIYKKLDFIMPEGYHVEMDKDGFNIIGFDELYMKFLSGGKPTVWSEFGKSICGISFFNSSRWDHQNHCPFREDVDFANQYMDFICDALVRIHVTGFAPWFWPGGIRPHEKGDHGLMGADGILRENGKAFLKHAKRLPNPNPVPPTHWLTVDRDEHPEGNYYLIFKPGKDAYAQYGDALGIRSAVTGMTSANVPRVAVGNVPYNGSNPHKYLNAEFNFFKINGAEVTNGGCVKVRGKEEVKLSVSIGNLHEVEWLSDGVFLACSNGGNYPLPSAVGAYSDVVFDDIGLKAEPGDTLRFRMNTSDGIAFGETFTISLQEME